MCMSESLGIRLNTDHLVCFQTLMGSVTPYVVRCRNRDSSAFYLILALYHILMPLETDAPTMSILLDLRRFILYARRSKKN